jgi:subtilisin family serine protease
LLNPVSFHTINVLGPRSIPGMQIYMESGEDFPIIYILGKPVLSRYASSQRGRKMKKIFAVLVVLVLLLSAVPVSAGEGPAGKSESNANNGVYIVRVVDEPVVAYKGGVKGLKATAPAKGQKIDPNSPAVVNYVSYLTAKHDALLKSVGGGKKLYSYVYSYNGFAAQISEAQAAKLAQTPGVLGVSADQMHEVDTTNTPGFLGISNPGGLWDMLGGVGSAGEGVIIGVIDSGIWPENPSFSDRTGLNGNGTKGEKLSFQQIPGWHGKCVPGEDFTATLCNQKLIGAQYFNASWGGDAGVEKERPWEFQSARDYNGHGTHTSSTAGGNYGVTTTGAAAAFGTINGMAPRARIAMYKALWSTEDGSTASGNTSDLVAAIDQAVADGVDVINYSISGTLTNFRDPAEIAFLYAAQAGIFVAASAGNSGPTTSTVAHPSPWITTVAAGTHNREGFGSVTLGNGASYSGASINSTPVFAPLVDSVVAGLPNANATAVSLCYASIDNGGVPVLDPVVVAGKIVVCDRGVTARVNKSLAVMEAGGVGMILVNTSANSINADFHYVPTVHLQNTDREAVKAYAATAGATATINEGVISLTAPAPFTASFSSRGPLQASGDLLKPDLIAPGQDILAAVSPSIGGMDFNMLSGTSMSSPHVAGLAALLKDLHPEWTPMMIKSALMTTGTDVLDGPNTHPLVIFRQGAGHVDPNSAAEPGLVFNSGWNDWLGFLCGTQLPTSFCTSSGIPVLDPSDFNSPSLAIADLAGSQTVKRTVMNVSSSTSTYSYSTTGFAGLQVEVYPASFTLAPGASQQLQITITTTTATLNTYTGGQITWRSDDGTHRVRIPAVVKPVALAAPAEVSGSYSVFFGYSGPFTATPRGLVPAVTFDGSINTGEQQLYEVNIAPGTTYARFSLFDDAVSPLNSDLDLVVYGPTETVVGSSGGGTSAEVVNLLNPVAGTYTVLVDGYATGNPSTYTLFTWAIPSTSAGNMTVNAPAAAVAGQPGSINLTFSALTSGTRYLGSIAYSGAPGMPNPTIVYYVAP